jgi:hypothetical protein
MKKHIDISLQGTFSTKRRGGDRQIHGLVQEEFSSEEVGMWVVKTENIMNYNEFRTT